MRNSDTAELLELTASLLVLPLFVALFWALLVVYRPCGGGGWIWEGVLGGGKGLNSMGYITPATVAEHNTHTDCWVSFLGKVFDLTKLVAENEGILTQPIVAVAGTDISHWFNARTGDVRDCLPRVRVWLRAWGVGEPVGTQPRLESYSIC